MDNTFIYILHDCRIVCNLTLKFAILQIQKSIKASSLPVNMERISYKISTKEGFFDFIANQWKLFIFIYAIPLMWNLLVTLDWKILANFMRAYFLLTC